MEFRGLKRAETTDELPAEKRSCSSSTSRASSASTSPQSPDSPTYLSPKTKEDGDADASSLNSGSNNSDGERDSAHESSDSDGMSDADPRLDEYLDHQQQNSSDNHARLNVVVSNLSGDVDQSAILAALMELCDLLSFSTEDSLSTMMVQSLCPIVVRLSREESDPDIMLLSIRAITYLCDAHSRASSCLVKHDAVPALCERLLTIEYLDVAEQCLQALEKISYEQPIPCLQSGAMTAVLTYIDFFSTSVQRVALNTAVNICTKLPPECPPSLMEAIPLLCNLLHYEDRQLVENVATCLVKIVKQLCNSSEKLDELCKHGLIHQATHLISLSSQTTLSPQAQSGLMGILVKLASGSIVAFRTLFEINISNILKDILSSYGRSHETSSLIIVDSTREVHEVFNLLNELLPAIPRDQDSNLNRDKERFLLNQSDLLQRFAMDLLPVLIQVVNSGGSLYGCYCCLSVVNKLLYYSNSDMLLQLLKLTNIGSFLAGVFTLKDHHVLLLALQIIDNILQKQSHLLLSSFVNEGLLFAVDALVMPERCSQYVSQIFKGIHLSNVQVQKSAVKDVPNCLCYAFENTTSSTSAAQTCKLEKDCVYNLAEHIRSAYFATELLNSKEATSDIFQNLKALSASLTDMVSLSSNGDASAPKEADFDGILQEIISQLNGRDPISTFEFVGSGIVKSLLGYLSVGQSVCGRADANGASNHDVYTVEKRLEVLGQHLFPSADVAGDPFLTKLIHILQSALSSVENFPVMLNHVSKQKKYYADVPYGRYYSYPCMEVQFVSGEAELNLNDCYGQVFSVDPFSSLVAIDEYLWPKITKGTSSATSQTLHSSPLASTSPHCQTQEFRDSDSVSLSLQDMQDSEEQKQQTSSSQEDSNPNLMNFESCNCGDASTNLFFYLNEEHLDHRLTLYQAILQHHIKAAQENITSASFWSQAYKLTYRRAVNCRQGCSQLQHQQAPCSVEKKLTYPQYSPLLSDMFVSDLASDVEKSSPTYDIILLLKVLESMNRFRFHFISHERACSFAEGRINKLDDLKVPVTCVPQNEFVNRRLTQKLEQQICDPYSLSIGGMPAWCSQLMSSCPFLFSFEVRSRYFRLAALGQRQNQPLLLSDSNSGGSNIGQLNTTSLPRKKFLVRRDQILESATKMMNLHASQVVVLEAEFEDEIGTGLGPTLEFYTLVSYEFQKLGLGMWREDHIPFPASKSLQVEHSIGLTTPCGLFPRPWSSSEVSDGVEFTEVINKYTLLGQVVAKALQDGRILDLPFSKAFYKLILEQDLTMYDIQLFDPTLCTTLLEFQAIVERNKYMGYLGGNKLSCITESCFRGTSIEDLCLDFSLPGYPDFVTSGCTSKMVNIINLEEYVSLIVDATIGSGISRQMEAFKLGFNQVFPIRHLQIFTEEELEHLLCGDEVWNINELLDHIKFDHGYTSSCPPVVNLLSIMREFDREQQKAFLRFVTGAARLPHGGLASLNPKLTVVRKHCSGFSDNDLPSAMTCAHYLKLPPYSSKEKMKEKLLYAITEGQGCFNLS